MWQFVQTYGIWILLGVVFLFMMMRCCGGGMQRGQGGCGMGHHAQDEGQTHPPRVVPFSQEERDDQHAVAPHDQERPPDGRDPPTRRSGGCC